MIPKQIKEYSNRLRINIVKTDGLNAGDNVIILTEQEYQEIKDNIIRLTDELNNTQSKLQTIKEQQGNLEEMMEKVTIPIKDNYEKQIKDKDKEIKQITDKYNALKQVIDTFKDSLNQLSFWDMIRKKHYNLINDFTNRIWIINNEDNIIDADNVPAITDNQTQQEK